MIWVVLGMLALATGVALVFIIRLLDGVGKWLERIAIDMQVRAQQDAAAFASLDTKPEPPPLPPLPSCLCGSVDLLLLNGYQRVRVVACQRCGKVFGVDAAGVRFDRHPEALPQYMTQRAMSEYARAEIEAAAERMKPRPGTVARGRGREIIERPGA